MARFVKREGMLKVAAAITRDGNDGRVAFTLTHKDKKFEEVVLLELDDAEQFALDVLRQVAKARVLMEIAGARAGK